MYPLVKDILALPELRKCYLLHQGVSCKQIVKSVTIMDNTNILQWLTGYEVLLSNGQNLVNFNNAQWEEFLSGLVSKNVAALFIKLSYFIDKLNDEVIEHSVKLDFPVVVVPNDYSWTKISNPIQQYVIEQQYYYIKKSVNLRDTLNKVLIRGGDLKDICTEASLEMGKQTAVFDQNWQWIGGTDCPGWEAVKKQLKYQYPKYREEISNSDVIYPHFFMHNDNQEVVFIPMSDQLDKLNHLDKNYLAIMLQDNQAIQSFDTYYIEQLIIFLMLFFYKEIELNRIEKHYYTNFLLDLVDGVLTDKIEIQQKAARLNKRVYASYQLIVFRNDKSSTKHILDDLLGLFKNEKSPICDILICERDQYIILFHPVNFNVNNSLIKKSCAKIADLLGQPLLQFGISRSYDITSIHIAYDEALFSLSVNQYVNQQLIYYEKLGLLRLFGANSQKVDTPFLSEFYLNTLQPLVIYDHENGTQLVETLNSFFKNELSISLTANKLYLHENTMRARIKRIESITGRSLKIPMDIAELVIGMQIYRRIENKNK